MAIMGTYPTPEGKVLAGKIRNEMIDNFGSGKTDEMYDDSIILCASKSKSKLFASRKENFKAYVAVRDGLKAYAALYSKIELKTAGVSKGDITQQIVNVTEDDNIILQGVLDFNPDPLFNVYSVPLVFNTDGVNLAEGGNIDSIEKFFNVLVAWLSFPMVDVNSSGMGGGAVIVGKGHIKFGENEDITEEEKKKEIFAEYTLRLGQLRDKSVQYYTDNQTVMPKMFEDFWDIIASGIVDFINTNEIQSKDRGIATLPESGKYKGASTGTCEFTSYMVPKLIVSFPAIPPLGELSFNFNAEAPRVACEVIEIVDKFGATKEIVVCPEIKPIECSFTNFVVKVSNAIKDALNAITEPLRKLLTRLGYGVTYVTNKIAEVIGKLREKMKKVVTAITDKIKEFIKMIADQIIIPVVRMLRENLWKPLMNVPYLLSYYTTKTMINLVKNTIIAIQTIVDVVIGIITKMIELIMYVVKKIGEFIAKIVDWWKDKLNSGDDLDDDSCKEFKRWMALLPNLPIPPIPELPEVPEKEPIGEDERCINPNYDPYDDKSPECVSCSSLDVYDPCPPVDDDGNDMSGDIPAKVPSDPVDDTDPLYLVASGIVSSALGI